MSLQRIAVRLCRTRSLRGACRRCYRVLACGLGLLLRGLPQIRAAYLAGSMATDDPEPGLSDIDFVLVVTDLPWDEEYRLVRRIEGILRYTMPPWGRPKVGLHVLIYAEREWALFADLFLGKRYGKPRTVFDKDGARPVVAMDDSIKGLHHFYKALWRLEGLQIALWKGPTSELEHQLCARMGDRMMLSIRNAVGEYSWRAEHTHAGQASDPVGEYVPAGMSPGATSGPDALPGLLQALDEAVFAYAPPVSRHACLGPGGGGETDEIVDRGTATALANSAAEGVTAWVSSMGSTDVVVLDSSDCAAATGIFLRTTAAGGRQPFIVTKTVFERLYLNAPFPSCSFTRMPEGKMLAVAGVYTRNRALIDAYAVLSKMRSAVDRTDRDQYRSMRATLEALTTYFTSRADGGGTSHRSEQGTAQTEPGSEVPHDPMRAFRQLHALAAHLVRALSSCLESRSP